MSEGTHTPTPWYAMLDDYGLANGRPYTVVGDEFRSIAAVWTQDVVGNYLPYKANAAFIVKACNSHEALLKCAEALRAVIAATQAYLPPDGIAAKECINRILQATDNAEIVAALSSLEASNG